jgi:2,3-bisphosphoglycerate-dependent phosphoglycerate mutase
MKIFLVRHGQSLANKERKHQGREDEWRNTPLSNSGKNQAKRVAERLKDEKFNLIYSSPLKRAKQTAEIINKFHNKKIVFDERLKEMHDDTETKEEFISRVQRIYKELTKKKGNILIVAHGGVIMTFLAISMGSREKGGRLVRRNYIGNGNTSVSILEKEKGKIAIKKMNCSKHLSKSSILRRKMGLLYVLPYKIRSFDIKEVDKEIENGDCRHKTELIKQLVEEEGLKARKIYAVFDWKDLPIPKSILNILKSGTKMTHELLEVNLNGKWIKIDLTWNRELKDKGFPVTSYWTGKEDTEMITKGKIKFYKTKEEAKKHKGLNKNKEELHKFADKFNEWVAN